MPFLKWLALPVLLIIMAEWSRSFSINGTQMSAIWPPAGIFLGACLALGFRALWVLVPALLFWSLFDQNMPIGLAVAGVVGLSIGAVVATWLIRRSKKVSNPLQRLLQRFENQAKEDFITGLANDRGMHEALQQELVLQPSGQHIAWLTYIKLPDLGVVNELFGLAGTTGIGTALAKHLQALCPNATIARMNQGKFAVLQRAGSIADVNELAHELYKVVASHYKLAARFESLKQAIENDALVLYAQEIRSLQPKDNRISFEVLVRMRDHDGQILAPAEFMPAAEAYGLMPALDRWVIKNTILYLSQTNACISTVAKCAINLSGVSLSDPELANFIGHCLIKYAVPAACITIEITETEAIRSPEQALTFINDVHAFGCKVALDDFGTGLASFDYLRQYPFDELKIDGVFIRNLANNTVDKSIVSAICQVAHSMNLQTVAEFVEDVSMSKTLSDLGVDFAQGYGIGKPKPLSDLFNEHNRPSSSGAPPYEASEVDLGDRSGHHIKSRLSF